MDMRTPGPSDIETAVASWTASLNSPQEIINYLNQGNCFMITREMYDKWNGHSPTSLHVYPAIFEDQLIFVLTDNVTDASSPIDWDYVFLANYCYGAPVKVKVNFGNQNGNGGADPDTTEGLERIFRWEMNKNQWVTDTSGIGDGIFQAFNVPYSDLHTLFDNGSIDTVYVLFGLIEGERVLIPDLLLWNEIVNFAGTNITADMCRPVPPFGIADPETNYQILVNSELAVPGQLDTSREHAKR
jgi:hypothetical protein